jgi:pimeloyl-ACP methyl ester carboxylesterase
MKFLLSIAAIVLVLAVASEKTNANDLPAYDSMLSTFAYPFPVQFLELKSQNQNLKMAYMDVAPQNPNGKVAVLLHGKNFGGYYWEPTIRELTGLGYRVVVPDQIGFGKSSKPQCYQFSFQGLAENTNALLETLRINQAAIVGHSMGGMLAVRFALMYPKVTAKLILINPLGLEDWKLKVPYHNVDELYAQELKTTPDSIRDYQRKSYYDGKWSSEYESLIQPQVGWTRHADFTKVAWASALTSEMIFTQPVIYEFSSLKVPTLLIIGQRDRTALGKAFVSKDVADTLGDYPTLGRAAARAIPGAKLVEIQGAGHLPQVEKFPEYKKAILDFLKN